MSVDTNNYLYGAQLGAEVLFCDSCRFDVTGFVKAAIFANSADASNSFANQQIFGNSSDGMSGNHAAGLVELGLKGEYRINDCWSITGGYQVMWLDSIALATDQIPRTGTGGGPFDAPLDSSHGALFQGGFVGVTVRRSSQARISSAILGGRSSC